MKVNMNSTSMYNPVFGFFQTTQEREIEHEVKKGMENKSWFKKNFGSTEDNIRDEAKKRAESKYQMLLQRATQKDEFESAFKEELEKNRVLSQKVGEYNAVLEEMNKYVLNEIKTYERILNELSVSNKSSFETIKTSVNSLMTVFERVSKKISEHFTSYSESVNGLNKNINSLADTTKTSISMISQDVRDLTEKQLSAKLTFEAKANEINSSIKGIYDYQNMIKAEVTALMKNYSNGIESLTGMLNNLENVINGRPEKQRQGFFKRLFSKIKLAK